VANLYPRITLGGSLGATALDVADLREEDNFRFSLSPLLTWPCTNPDVSQTGQPGRGRSRTSAGQSEALVASYQIALLKALAGARES